MAVIPAVVERHGIDWFVISWAALANGDTGEPVSFPAHSDRSVQLSGTLGATGACTIQGSNFSTSPTWATLNDPNGNPLVMLALAVEQVLENTLQIRPNITAGDGTTSLTVKMLLATSARR